MLDAYHEALDAHVPLVELSFDGRLCRHSEKSFLQ